MIVIDKSKSAQNIILTLSEQTTIADADYLMVLKCDATGVVSKFFLPPNTSTATERYDLFTVDNTTFKAMDAGYYTYTVYQQAQNKQVKYECLSKDVVEEGKLLIKALVHDAAGEYIVY